MTQTFAVVPCFGGRFKHSIARPSNTLRRHAVCVLTTIAVLLGCGSADDTQDSGVTPASSGSPPPPGCTTAGACAGCATCLERCLCEHLDTGACTVHCETAGVPNPAPTSKPAPTSEPAPTTEPPPAPPAPASTTPPIEPPVAQYETVTITSATFEVPPGGEVFRCQNFRNPIGKDVAIVESESSMSPGSHHMFLFREPTVLADSNAVEICSGIEFRDYVHLAQRPHVKWTYPEGVARLLRASDGLRLSVHYLNTSTETLRAQISVTLAYDDPAEFRFLAAPLFLNQTVLVVPPGRSTASRDYVVPYSIQMLRVVGHMHSRGVQLDVSTSTGQSIYTTDSWDEPEERAFEPPLEIPGGSIIRWSCAYENATAMTFTFGESADLNEMCITYGLFYPTDPNANQGVSLSGLF